MATALLGQGTLIKRGDGATPTEVFTAIENVSSISGPTASKDQLDVTSQSSTGRIFITGLLDPGEITFQCYYDPDLTQQGLIEDDFTAGTEHNYELVFPNAGSDKCQFAATPTQFSITAPVDGALTLDVTLKISGAVTWPTQ